MKRALSATVAALLVATTILAADPQPVWELDVSGIKRPATLSDKYGKLKETKWHFDLPEGNCQAPGWLGYSPDGKALVAVTVNETTQVPREYLYQLHVWDVRTRKARFSTNIGATKCPHWCDDLATFPTNNTVLTGGQSHVTRNLENGQQTSFQPIGGVPEYAVWAVPDLQETFFLHRDPARHGQRVELHHRQRLNVFDDYSFRAPRGGNQNVHHTTIPIPREGMRTETIAMNPGRTRLVAAFRDETMDGKPRHSLVTYEIRTMEQFTLVSIAEATNPHPGPVSAMAFARNGRILATGGEDGSVAVWDVTDAGPFWKPRATVSGVADHRVRAIAFNPDWRVIAAVTWDRAKPNLLLIDVDSGKLIRSARVDRELSAVTFSPDGLTLVTGSGSGKIRGWDVRELLKGE